MLLDCLVIRQRVAICAEKEQDLAPNLFTCSKPAQSRLLFHFVQITRRHVLARDVLLVRFLRKLVSQEASKQIITKQTALFAQGCG